MPFSCFDGDQFPFLPPTWFSNIHLATPNASRATTPIGDMETFDPSRPSVSQGDLILLPVGKVPGYLDTALKALTIHLIQLFVRPDRFTLRLPSSFSTTCHYLLFLPFSCFFFPTSSSRSKYRYHHRHLRQVRSRHDSRLHCHRR